MHRTLMWDFQTSVADSVECSLSGVRSFYVLRTSWMLSDPLPNYVLSVYAKQCFGAVFIDQKKEGFLRIQNRSGLWNLMSDRGELLSHEWFARMSHMRDGMVYVQRSNNTSNYLTKEGTYLLSEWHEMEW